jgi:tRNA(adenine34) deaminase
MHPVYYLVPCQMCFGSSYWAQIGTIVYRASEPERDVINLKITLHPKKVVAGGVLEKECSQLLTRFLLKNEF